MSDDQEGELHVKFFPYQVMLEITALVIIAGVLLGATSFPAELRPEYDPMNPPAHLLPEWYFMSVYMILKTDGLGEPIIGLMVLTGIFLGLVAMPFLDKGKDRHPLKRPKATSIGIFIGAELMTLWYLGENVGSGELNAMQMGIITISLILISFLLVRVTRRIYFRYGYTT